MKRIIIPAIITCLFIPQRLLGRRGFLFFYQYKGIKKADHKGSLPEEWAGNLWPSA